MQSGLSVFTLVHVVLSVLGIVSGLVVVGGFFAGARFDRWIAVFLGSTLLTSATGFGFPFTQLLPSHMVGALSLACPSPFSRCTESTWKDAGAKCSWASPCWPCT